MAAIFTKQSGIRAVSVGADAHIGPLGSYEFAEDSRKIGTSCGWTRGVRPYRGRARVVVGADVGIGSFVANGCDRHRPLQLARERPGLPRQCENQIMLGCQQSGVSRPIMVTMVGATLARP